MGAGGAMADGIFMAISDGLGVVYLLAWSCSFWPQILLNYKRKSVSGTTIDFPLANLTGFTAYTIYTASFLFSSTIRVEYAQRYPKNPVPTVRWNDFAFALHGWLAIALLLVQFRLYDDEEEQQAGRRPSRWILTILGACTLTMVCVVAFTIGDDGSGDRGGLLEWIDVIYALSGVKLFLTLVKYVPQVILNYRRQSTTGWPISIILLDLTGGIFSLLQWAVDTLCFGNVDGGISGNLVKILLALYSMIFDFIFIIQHYVLYGYMNRKQKNKASKGLGRSANSERQPLLSGS